MITWMNIYVYYASVYNIWGSLIVEPWSGMWLVFDWDWANQKTAKKELKKIAN